MPANGGSGSTFAGWINTDGDDNTSTTTSLAGTTFKFQGAAVTGFQACSNGWMTFNTSNVNYAWTNNLGVSSVTENASLVSSPLNRILAPFWDDLVFTGQDYANRDNSLRYQITGTLGSGSAIITLEWAGIEKYNIPGPNLNFQVKLFETDNHIEFIYGNFEGFDGTFNDAYTYSVGYNGETPATTGSTNRFAQQTANANFFSGVSDPTTLSIMPKCNTRISFTPGTYSGLTAAPAISIPSNDEVAGAITIPVLTTTTGGLCGTYYSSLGATDSGAGQACATTNGFQDDDVWFKFVTTAASSYAIRLRSASGYTGVLQLFDSSMTAVSCVNATSTGSTEVINATGLTSGGSTYYLRAFHDGSGASASGEFSITVNEVILPPTNDDITGATSLTVNPTCSTTNSQLPNTTSATASSTTPAATLGNADDDVWYSFVASSAIQTITVQSGSGYNAVFQVLSSSNNLASGTLTSLTTVNNTSTAGSETFTATTLTAGNTYFVRVFNFAIGAGTGNFTICITAPAPACITNSSPANLSTGQNLSLALSWASTTLATSYDLYLGTASGTQTFLANSTTTSYTLTAGQALQGATSYFWYVVPKNANGSASCGVANESRFTTLCPTPTTTAQTFCSGATVGDLVATGTAIKWYNVATGGTSLISTASLISGTYYATQTINGIESARLSVVITVNIPAAPTASAQSFCNAATVSDLVATGTALKWYSVSTGGSSLASTTALSSNTYYVSQTLNSCEGLRRAVLVTINANPTSGGTISDSQSLCSPANPATFLSVSLPSGHTGTLEYKWQSSTNNIDFTDIAGANLNAYNAPFGLTETTYYKRLSRVSCQSDWTGAAQSNVITVTVSPVITTSFTQVNSICLGGTLAALPTTSNNGVSGTWSPAINSSATTSYTFTPSAGQCATNASMTIAVDNTVVGTVSSDQIIVSGLQPADITLTGSSGAIQWQSSTNNINFTNIIGSTDNILTSNEAGGLTTNTFYRAVVKSGSCPSANSSVVSVTIVTGSSVINSQCGTTLATINTHVLAKYIQGITDYRFKVVANGTTQIVSAIFPRNLDLTTMTNGAAYNTAYTISVATKYNGVWGPYGPACVVSTPLAPTTKVQSFQSGATLPLLYSDIYADWVQFATDYRFKVVGNGTTEVIDRGSKRYFNLTQLTAGAAFNTAYTISVAVKLNGAWGVYGTESVLSTPMIPTSKVQDSQNGTTLPLIYSDIVADWAQFATDYRFKVVGNGTTEVIDRGNRRFFNLTMLTGGAAFNTAYTISVAVKINGAWGAYGAESIVTTPMIPTSKVQDSQCGITLADNNTDIFADWAQFATEYRFKVVVNGTPYIITPTVANTRKFNLTSLPVSVLSGTNYTVSVAVKIYGAWGAYGTECVVTTPRSAGASKQIVKNTDFSIVAYPNPSNGVFKLQVNGSNNEAISVLVFDMMGRQIESSVINAEDVENISLGQNYAAGVYNVIVAQGTNTKTIRLVRK
jgi:hypothetical protein